MRFLFAAILLMLSANSFALKITIEKKVENGFSLSPLSKNPKLSRSARRFKKGVRMARALYLSDKTLGYAEYQISKVKEKLPVGFNRIKKLKIVPTIFDDEKSNNPTNGRYHPFSNKIKIRYKLFFKGYELKLLQTLIHEISHAYEKEVEHISIREKFLYLAGWHRKGLLFKWKTRRNFLNHRSPDPYEFTNTSEAFAVNMEHFLLDPEYQCRRPLMNKYLSVELMQMPFWSDDEEPCQKLMTFPMQHGDKIGFWNMDPKKLYEIHYLLADEGREASSSFGHTMIRLVMCAPHRKVVDKNCLKDIEHHVVLSYRANVDDAYLNMWKGLMGGYSSLLFVYPMVSIINEYTRDQFRNLISIPIDLQVFERADFLSKMQEEIWAYKGKYQFITQNCATETLDFFKSIVDRMAFSDQFSFTPRGVLKIFSKYGMTYDKAKTSSNKKWKLANSYLIESVEPAYRRFYDKIKQFSKYENLKDYLDNSSATERMKIIDELTQVDAKADTYAAMYKLEKFVNILRQRSFQDDMVKLGQTKDGENQLKRIIDSKLDFARNKFPAKKLGYGIPNQSEFEEIKEYVHEKNNVTSFDPLELKSFLDTHFSEQIEEVGKGQTNEKRLKALTISF